ncbi:MAG: Phosphatidylglycerol/phosphatidylinositol transfer protein [Sclerophora amabilis]|nr:MAG: Phosphatidylglycerol/phosphatidylinositol transfer protein [Sclerophora amabilis]
MCLKFPFIAWSFLLVPSPTIVFSSLPQKHLTPHQNSFQENITDSPARHCDDPTNDIFQIEYVRVSPNPPERGFYCGVEMGGTFQTDPGDDLQLVLNITNDGQRCIDTVRPWCEMPKLNIVQDGEKVLCPLKRGSTTLTYAAPLYPAGSISDGTYTVRIETSTNDNRRLFCLIGTAIFPA